MKIVIISSWFINYTIELANSLSKENEVLVVMRQDSPEIHLTNPNDSFSNYIHRFLNKNVELSLVRFHRLRDPRCLLTSINIARSIRKFKPDLIHLHATSSVRVLWALPFLRKFPLVVTVHDPRRHLGEENLEKSRRASGLYKRADKLIAHGNESKDILLMDYSLEEDNIFVIPFGNLAIHQSTKKFEENKNSILFFGRIAPHKGLKYLIKAESLISEVIPDIKIVIAGQSYLPGHNFKIYEQLMENRELYVIHNEYISEEKVSELFSKSSIVVLPYIQASQSGVATTAFGFGKPVIATNVGSIPEVVENGKTGLIVPAKDPISIANAVIKLLQDDDLRVSMGQNARSKIENDLSWNAIAKETTKVYQSLFVK